MRMHNFDTYINHALTKLFLNYFFTQEVKVVYVICVHEISCRSLWLWKLYLKFLIKLTPSTRVFFFFFLALTLHNTYESNGTIHVKNHRKDTLFV